MRLPPPGPRRDLAIALLLALVSAVFRLPRLGTPNEEVFDEVYHAKTALEYLNGQNPTEWVHPPTAKLLIAVGVWVFGYRDAAGDLQAYAWRILPALFGIALAPVFYVLARRVLPTERAALLASGALLCDGVYLVQSRIAMTNIFAVFFQVTALYFILRAAPTEPLDAGEMGKAGLFLALALSTRWTSLWATGFAFLVLAAVRRTRLLRLRELALLALAFGVIPLVVYVASYIPWMWQADPWTRFKDLPEHTYAIWRYHSDLRADHPYFSKWYTWPWLYRPTWYYFHQEAGTVAGIVAIGNPILWWISVPLSVWAVASAVRITVPTEAGRPGGPMADIPITVLVRDPRLLLTGMGFFALYLPWGLSPRTLNYSHYLFEAIPWACLSLGLLLDRYWDGPEAPLARGYAAVLVFVFLFFTPFLLAIPVPQEWFNWNFHGWRPWTWFRTWV